LRDPRIREAYSQTVEAVFQVGRELLQAKRELPHGEFMAMVERELPFSYNTANRYMEIASASHLRASSIARSSRAGPSFAGTNGATRLN